MGVLNWIFGAKDVQETAAAEARGIGDGLGQMGLSWRKLATGRTDMQSAWFETVDGLGKVVEPVGRVGARTVGYPLGWVGFNGGDVGEHVLFQVPQQAVGGGDGTTFGDAALKAVNGGVAATVVKAAAPLVTGVQLEAPAAPPVAPVVEVPKAAAPVPVAGASAEKPPGLWVKVVEMSAAAVDAVVRGFGAVKEMIVKLFSGTPEGAGGNGDTKVAANAPRTTEGGLGRANANELGQLSPAMFTSTMPAELGVGRRG